MKILNVILVSLTIYLFSASAYADQAIDISGIYQSVNGDKNYLSINRNNDQYVLINISKELGLLYKLGLITEEELNHSSVRPLVEEFAFSFQIDNSELLIPEFTLVTLGIIPDIIIPFPYRTSSLKVLPFPLITIHTSTVVGNAPEIEVVTTTSEVAPYCLISLEINPGSGKIIVGFKKFTSPEFLGTDHAFIPIDHYYKKIF